MLELGNLIARHEMRCEQLVIHLREMSRSATAECERMQLFALLEDLALLKGERQRREDLSERDQAACGQAA